MGFSVKACIGIFLLVIAALLVALIVVVPIIYVILSEKEQVRAGSVTILFSYAIF